MKMRTRRIKEIILLLALSVTCALGAVIQQQSSTPQISSSTAKTVEQIRNRPTPSVPVISGTHEESDASKRSEKSQTNATAIGESIKMVASQLLHSNKTPPPPTSGDKNQSQVQDIRTPPFMKNQQVNKTKIVSKPVGKPDESKKIENSHAGIAIPVSHEEIEKEIELKTQTNKRKPVIKETTTTVEGLSTWVLVNGKPTPTTTKPENKSKVDSSAKGENVSSSSNENKKPQNKQKPSTKPTRTPITPQIKPIFVRKPVLISSNKSDLIASGSAVNENEMNKIKASVLANVQKNAAALGKTTTSSEISVSSASEKVQNNEEKIKDTSKEIMIKINQVNLKNKKKSETKDKQTIAKVENEVAKADEQPQSNEMESKIAEIELPVSTPSPVTKTKSKKKKNKNRRRKPSTSVSTKIENKEDDTKTKVNKKVKEKTEQNDTNIYNFISRKVIPSVGIGLVSLAGLFGIASYFFNPFGTLRRSDNLLERKDLYHYNDEQYADDGGQREEDVLVNLFPEPTVDNKIHNSNIRPNVNRYQVNPTQFTYSNPKSPLSSTEQNIRYRNVGYVSDTSHHNFVSHDRIGPKSPDIVQGSSYSENIHYDTHSTDSREPFAVYPQPQPVYKAPDRQVDNSEYGSDVYHAMSPYSGHHQLSDPTYGQPLRYNHEMFETTETPLTNVVHINNEDVIEHQKETGYTVDALAMDSDQEPQFVVGNIPKELIQATPVTVPEHGPRSLKIRKRRDVENESEVKIESAADSLKNILKAAGREEDDSMSNEIDNELMKVYNKEEANTNTYMNSYRNETFEKVDMENSSINTNTPTTSYKEEDDSYDKNEPQNDNSDDYLASTSTASTITEDYTSVYHETRNPILDFIRGFIDFKLKLGISILKATSDNLARYLKDIEGQFNVTTPQLRSRFR